MTTYLLTDKFTNKVMIPSLTQKDFIRKAKAINDGLIDERIYNALLKYEIKEY